MADAAKSPWRSILEIVGTAIAACSLGGALVLSYYSREIGSLPPVEFNGISQAFVSLAYNGGLAVCGIVALCTLPAWASIILTAAVGEKATSDSYPGATAIKWLGYSGASAFVVGVFLIDYHLGALSTSWWVFLERTIAASAAGLVLPTVIRFFVFLLPRELKMHVRSFRKLSWLTGGCGLACYWGMVIRWPDALLGATASFVWPNPLAAFILAPWVIWQSWSIALKISRTDRKSVV